MATIPVSVFFDLCQQLEKNPDYVLWISSPDYFEQIYLSPSFETIWGVPAQTIYDNPASWCDYLEETGRAEWIRQLCARTPDNRNRVVNFIIQRPDGELRYLQDRIYFLVNQQQQQVAIAGICQVLTPEQWAQENAAENGFQAGATQLAERLHTQLTHTPIEPASAHGKLKLSCLKPGYSLSPREQQTLYYVLLGHSAKEIGKLLTISPRTIEVYINTLKEKMNCTRKLELQQKMRSNDVSLLLRSLRVEPMAVIAEETTS